MTRQRKLRTTRAIGAWAFALTAVAAASAADRPRVWTWCPPLGDADNQPNINYKIYITTEMADGNYGCMSPEAAAWQAYKRTTGNDPSANPIADYDVRIQDPNNIWIYLHLFGHGNGDAGGVPLARHPLDALDPNDPDLVTEFEPDLDISGMAYWITPWMSHGINDPDPRTNSNDYWGAKAWMEAFCDSYLDIQDHNGLSDPNYPYGDLLNPARFHFDTEPSFVPALNEPTVGHGKDDIVDLFVAMSYDPRWGTESIPGTGGQTLAQLWAEYCGSNAAPRDVLDYTQSCESATNLDWYVWYKILCRQALEGAMYEAAYSVINDHKDDWTQCKHGNYYYSLRIDGETCAKSAVGGHWYDYIPATPFVRHQWWSSQADLQPVELYPRASGMWDWINRYLEPDVSYIDAMLWLWRNNLHACIDSFGGGHADEVTPWIFLPNKTVNSHSLSEDDSRRLLAMLRAHDIREMLVYEYSGEYDPSEAADWNIFAELLDQVWGTDYGSIDVFYGSYSATVGFSEVKLSDDSYLKITAANDGVIWKTITQLYIDPDFDTMPEQLRVHLEAKVADASADVTARITIRNVTAGTWEQLGSDITVDNAGDKAIVYRNLVPSGSYTLDDYLTANNQFRLRVTFSCATDGFKSKTDLIQVVGSDDD